MPIKPKNNTQKNIKQNITQNITQKNIKQIIREIIRTQNNTLKNITQKNIKQIIRKIIRTQNNTLKNNTQKNRKQPLSSTLSQLIKFFTNQLENQLKSKSVNRQHYFNERMSTNFNEKNINILFKAFQPTYDEKCNCLFFLYNVLPSYFTFLDINIITDENTKYYEKITSLFEDKPQQEVKTKNPLINSRMTENSSSVKQPSQKKLKITENSSSIRRGKKRMAEAMALGAAPTAPIDLSVLQRPVPPPAAQAAAVQGEKFPTPQQAMAEYKPTQNNMTEELYFGTPNTPKLSTSPNSPTLPESSTSRVSPDLQLYYNYFDLYDILWNIILNNWKLYYLFLDFYMYQNLLEIKTEIRSKHNNNTQNIHIHDLLFACSENISIHLMDYEEKDVLIVNDALKDLISIELEEIEKSIFSIFNEIKLNYYQLMGKINLKNKSILNIMEPFVYIQYLFEKDFGIFIYEEYQKILGQILLIT